MRWLNTRYKRLGLVLVLSYLLLQAAVIYGYYLPPAHAREWTNILANLLPWIAGVKLIGTLSLIGERLSFTMAIAYLPGLALGVFIVLREIAFNGESKAIRATWIDTLTCIFLLAVMVLVHYIGYWQKYAWGRTPQLIHTFIAVYVPFICGFLFTSFALLVKRLASTVGQNSK